MPRITPNFHFNGCCRQAIAAYREAFGAMVLSLLTGKDANPADWKAKEGEEDLVYHGELEIKGQRVMMSDDMAPSAPSGNSISLVVTFDTAEEVKQAFRVLEKEAVILGPMVSTTYSSCFVSLIDAYGMRWELMTEQTER